LCEERGVFGFGYADELKLASENRLKTYIPVFVVSPTETVCGV
jgi:hypothetical protein